MAWPTGSMELNGIGHFSQSTLLIPKGSHVASGETFERSTSTGLLEYSLHFASYPVLASGDEFPGMVPRS